MIQCSGAGDHIIHIITCLAVEHAGPEGERPICGWKRSRWPNSRLGDGPASGTSRSFPNLSAAPRFPFISVDDHIVEPPDCSKGESPRSSRTGPWVSQGRSAIRRGSSMGTPPERWIQRRCRASSREYSMEPARFDEMRRGAWDIDARIADMDLNGVYASVNFPSSLAGFGGQRLTSYTDDRELALAMVRAWNDWHLESWAGPHPDRMIPLQIPWRWIPRLVLRRSGGTPSVGSRR